MKSKVTLAIGLFGMLALTSCKKDWECDCTITAGAETATTQTELKDASKSDAEEWCDGLELNSFYNCSLSAK